MPNQSTPPLPDPAETRSFTPRLMRWGFGAIMAVVVFITALSFWRVEVGNRVINEIVSHEQVAVELLYRMQLASRDRMFALVAAVHTDDPFVQDSEIQRFYALGAAFGKAHTKLEQLTLTQTERTLLAQQRAQIVLILPL